MFSLILEPDFSKQSWSKLGICTGVALSEVLGKYGVHPKIKWPNDILVNGKKIAGILTEADQAAIVVGIGMNLNMSSVPEVESTLKPTSFLIETDCKLDPKSYALSVQRHLTELVSGKNRKSL